MQIMEYARSHLSQRITHFIAGTLVLMSSSFSITSWGQTPSWQSWTSYGQHPFRYWGFYLYDAELLVSQSLTSPTSNTNTNTNANRTITPLSRQQLFNQPFALRLKYQRDLTGKRISQSSSDEIQRLKLASTLGQFEAWDKAMKQIFVDVTTGDEIIGVYRPQSPTVFYKNKQLLGTVDDAQFGVAFFNIWLHADTKAQAMKQAWLVD
jgi:hypothetical protein